MLDRIIGLLMFAAGVVMLTLAYQEYGAFGSKFTRLLSQTLSDRTIYLFSGGAACSLIGIYQIMRRSR